MSDRRNNRGKIEIVADILKICTEEMKKTHVMYKANLSYVQILFYLNQLVIRGLLDQKINGASSIYKTTMRGREFLQRFAELNSFIEGLTASRLAIPTP